MLAVMLCAVISGGCGGGSDSSSPEQTESLNDDTGSYDPNEEARGNSDRVRYLSTLTEPYTAHDGEILTGTLGSRVLLQVADGATITLRNATIYVQKLNNGQFVGLSFEGDATLILEGTNYVQSFHHDFPAIRVPADHTLTIKGIGKLTAYAVSTNSAGIGGGYKLPCGNIVIEGGTIIAHGGSSGAGIGGGYYGKCGKITIKDTVTKVTATKGIYAQHSIGAGKESTCGKVMIGGKYGAISTSPYTYQP